MKVASTILRGRNGEVVPRVQALITRLLGECTVPKVLEAGCGSASHVRWPQGTHVVGIDMAQRQLDANAQLAERVKGDLQTHRWAPDQFDLVICWDVIEHLPDPVAALDRMADGLRPGGALVLAFPNLWSLKGLVTKFTPFWVHMAFYRYVIGDKRQVDQSDQFPTYLHTAIRPSALRAWARTRRLELAYDEIYEGPVQTHMRRKNRLMNAGFWTLGAWSKVVSLGSLDLGLSDCVLVFRRPSVAAAIIN